MTWLMVLFVTAVSFKERFFLKHLVFLIVNLMIQYLLTDVKRNPGSI